MRDKSAIWIGQRFGRLTVSESHASKNSRSAFVCSCDCGRSKVILAQSLKSGATVSCGCLGKERRAGSRTTHGQTKHPLFGVWGSMLQRCGNPNNTNFRHYGARGITVCSEWIADFPAFLAWATENGWKAGLELDRIDNDSGYYPSNCRFVTRKEQIDNRRCSVKYEFNGKQMSVPDIAKIVGINPCGFTRRLKRGWTFEEAISTPSQRPA